MTPLSILLGCSWLLCMIFVCLLLTLGALALAELIENHRFRAVVVIKTLIGLVIASYVLFFVVGFIDWLTAFIGIIAHGWYSLFLLRFPYCKPFGTITIGAGLLFAATQINLFLSFRHRPSFVNVHIYVSPVQLVSFFFVSVWAVPFLFLLSLVSVDDDALPGGNLHNAAFAKGLDLGGAISPIRRARKALFGSKTSVD